MLPPKTLGKIVRCVERSLLVVCETGNRTALDYWTKFYNKYTRYCGPENFSLLDLTAKCDLNLDWWETATAPFSYICMESKQQDFVIRVDSDFVGLRPVRDPIFVPFHAVNEDKFSLASIMWYDPTIHDGPMKLRLTNIDEVVLFSMIPKYPTNYSEPGVPVYEQYSAGVYVYEESHYSHAIPFITQDGVALFLKPRRVYKHFLLLEIFDAAIWISLIVFTVVMAVIVTISIRRPPNTSSWQNFMNNIILMFCQTFTNISVPDPSKFKFSSGAILAILWSILGIILLTGYKSSLSSYLQHPPRAPKHPRIDQEKYDVGKETGIFFRTPRLDRVIEKLHTGGYWTGNSVSIKFLTSFWGLEGETYTVPYTTESQVLQCLNDGVVFACRSVRLQIRRLFESCVMYYFLRKVIEGYMSYALKGVVFSELLVHEDKAGHGLELSVCLPFFEALFLGIALSWGCLFFEIVTASRQRESENRRSNEARRDLKKELYEVHQNLYSLDSG